MHCAHGTAKIVETVPWYDAKLYASTQAPSTRRATSRCSPAISTRRWAASIRSTPNCGMLLDDIINDSRWDMTYLGMQVMVEGLALAALASCTR